MKRNHYEQFEEGSSSDVRPDFPSYRIRIDDEHRERLLKMLIDFDIELRVKGRLPVSPLWQRLSRHDVQF